MLKGQDVLLLLNLLDRPQGWTVRALAAAIASDPAGVHRGLRRLADARLLDPEAEQVNRSNAEEFLIHGLKFLFPPVVGGLVRGMPTAWAAPPLERDLERVDEPPPVWPDQHGEARGVALEPLHKSVVAAVRNNSRLREPLALIDGIRLGDGRVRPLAESRLDEWLWSREDAT